MPGQITYYKPKRIKSLYLIGSMRNADIPAIAVKLRKELGIEIFDSWHDAGPEADDYWQKNERLRGTSYTDALAGYHAQDVFNFDKHHLDRTDGVALIMPAGRSGHLELGYTIGKGKPGYIVLPEEPDRYDVMYNFCRVTGGAVVFGVDALIEELKHG